MFEGFPDRVLFTIDYRITMVREPHHDTLPLNWKLSP